MFKLLRRDPAAAETRAETERQREQIWVCVGGPCKELGSVSVLDRVRRVISGRGLQHQVRVREAACLALCGAGPNLKVMPDRVRYWETTPAGVEGIVDAHFRPGEAPQVPEGTTLRVEEGRVIKAPLPGADTHQWKRPATPTA